MAITVQIPTALRRHTDGVNVVYRSYVHNTSNGYQIFLIDPTGPAGALVPLDAYHSTIPQPGSDC